MALLFGIDIAQIASDALAPSLLEVKVFRRPDLNVAAPGHENPERRRAGQLTGGRARPFGTAPIFTGRGITDDKKEYIPDTAAYREYRTVTILLKSLVPSDSNLREEERIPRKGDRIEVQIPGRFPSIGIVGKTTVDPAGASVVCELED